MSGPATLSKVASKSKIPCAQDQPASEPSLETDTSNLTVENVRRLEEQYKSLDQHSRENSVEDYILQTQLSTLERPTSSRINTEKALEATVSEQPILAPPLKSHWEDRDHVKSELESGGKSEVDGALTAPRMMGISQSSRESEAEVSITADSTTQKKWETHCVCPDEYMGGQELDITPFATISVQTQTEWSWLNQSPHPDANDVAKDKLHEMTVSPESGGHPSSKTQQGFAKESGSSVLVLDAASWSEFEDNLYQRISKEGSYIDIGPPSILAYKAESRQSPSDFDVELQLSRKNRQVTVQPPSDHFEPEGGVPCEFCCQTTKPFPTSQQLDTQPAEKLFCCRLYQELYYYLLREQKKLIGGPELIDIISHSPFGSKKDQRTAKERAAQRLWEKEQEKYRAYSQTNVHSLNHQVDTISYQLSSAFCMEQGWTVPFSPLEEMEIDSVFIPTSDLHEKYLKSCHGFVQKSYPNGKPFLTIFADGTGQVFYLSGNVAIAITSVHPTLYTFVILEDHDSRPKIRAVFKSNGHSTCYHPNGVIRVNLNPYGGCCLDKTGTRQKRWQWRDFSRHVHAPPFQPICLSLNSNIGVRIVSQDRIYVTFTSKRNRVKFNMGARLMLRQPGKCPRPKPDVMEDELQLQSKMPQITTLLDKIQTVITHPHCVHLIKMQLEHQHSSSPRIKGTKGGKKAGRQKLALQFAKK